MIDKTKKIVMNNSMSNLLDVCEKRFFFKYLLNKPTDSDYIKPTYFLFGSCFHEILDKTLHNGDLFTTQILNEITEKHGLDPVYEKAKMVSCLLEYYKMHKLSGLKTIKTEYYFEFDSKGTLDAIMEDTDGGWWIIDTKTAKSLSDSRSILLFKDQQLNLYAHHAEDIKLRLKEKEGIELGEFKGIKYREITKAQERKKKVAETFEQFYQRLSPSTYREHTLTLDILNTKKAKQNVLNKTERVQNMIDKYLANGENIDILTENTQNCINFITKDVCPFFSQCHGVQYSASKPENQSFEDLI